MAGLVWFSRTFIIQRPQQMSLIWVLIVTRPTWLLPPRKVPLSCGITVSSTRTAVFLVKWIITHYMVVVTSLKGKSGLLTTGSQHPLNNQDTSRACSILGLIDIDSLTHVAEQFHSLSFMQKPLKFVHIPFGYFCFQQIKWINRGVDKTRNTEHSGTFRNIPEHPGTWKNNSNFHEKNKIK